MKHNDFTAKADAVEKIFIPEPKKEPENLIKILESKTLEIDEWKEVIASLTEFRESSLLRSTSRDQALKKILAKLIFPISQEVFVTEETAIKFLQRKFFTPKQVYEIIKSLKKVPDSISYWGDYSPNNHTPPETPLCKGFLWYQLLSSQEINRIFCNSTTTSTKTIFTQEKVFAIINQLDEKEEKEAS